MDRLRPTPLVAPQHSPATVQPLAPVGAPQRIGNTAFPDFMTPRSVDSAAMSALARIVSEEKDTERGFIASTALAAFKKENLSRSRVLGKDGQQAQYGIKVWSQKGELLGRLAADVKQAGQKGYQLLAVHFTRAGSSTSIDFKRDAHGVLQTAPGQAAPLPGASSGKRVPPVAGPRERAEAQDSWAKANRDWAKGSCIFSNAETLAP